MSVTRLQRVLRVCNFGAIPAKYSEVSVLQEKLAELCRQKKASDTLLHLQVLLARHERIYMLVLSVRAMQCMHVEFD